MKRRAAFGRIAATGFTLNCIALLLTRLRPADRWYWDARFFSRRLAWALHTFHPNLIDPSLEARLLHRFIDMLAEGGRRFPIPTRVEGLPLLQEFIARGEGFVCCGAHVPFVKLFITVVRKAMPTGADVAVVAKYPNPDGSFDVWCDDPVRAVTVGSGALLQTRSLLRRRGCLLLLTDKEQGEYISSNIFRFVGKVGARLLMAFPELLPDGTILLQFIGAPAPECRNELEIRANLDFVAEKVRTILVGGEVPENLRPSVMPMAQVAVAERGREIDRIQLYSRTQLEARARRLQHLLSDPTITVSDRALYERRLSFMHDELEMRSRTQTRSEFAEDGTPLY